MDGDEKQEAELEALLGDLLSPGQAERVRGVLNDRQLDAYQARLERRAGRTPGVPRG